MIYIDVSDFMGDVLLIYRVMPEGTEVDLDALETALKAAVVVNKVERVKVAFGLEALRVEVITPDEEGVSDKVEETLQGLEGVQSVNCEGMTLI